MGASYYPEQRPRYRPVNQMAPKVPGGAPAGNGLVQFTGPAANRGGAGGRTDTGDLMGGKTSMPGGGQPASAGGFRPFRPATGQQGMGGRPGIGQQRPGVGAVAPRPAAPPAPPPPPPMPPAPMVEPPNPGGTPFPQEPDGSLAGQTFLPGDDKRLQGAQSATDAAFKSIADGGSYSTRAGAGGERYRKVFGSGQVDAGDAVNAADGGRYLDEQDAALKGLGGPSRTELAKQALADFDAQGEKALAGRFRKVGQSAAKFGRLGMGDVNAELGSIQGDFERDRMQRENELARSVAEGDIGDRFRRVDATSGLRRGESGIEQGIRGERRVERDYGTGLDERNQDRSFDRQRSAFDLGGRDASQDIGNEYDELSAAGSLEDRIFGQGQQNRGEFRTERGFQEGRRQQSLEERIRQRELENAEREAAFNRSYRQSIAGR